MDMKEILLNRDGKDKEIFRSESVVLSKETIEWLIAEGYLKKVVMDVIPTQFSAELLINLGNESTTRPELGIYTIEVYTEWLATSEMKDPAFVRKNKDIDICEESGKVEFVFAVDECNKLISYNEGVDGFILMLPGVLKLQ